MTPEQIALVLFIFIPLVFGACCIGLAGRYDDGRAAPKGARLR